MVLQGPWYAHLLRMQCTMYSVLACWSNLQQCTAPLACDWYATGVWGATSGLSLSTISGGTTQGGRGGRLDGDRERGEAGYGGCRGETHFPDLRLPTAQPTADLRLWPKPNRWVPGWHVRWPIGIYLDNDVEAGAWRYPTADPEQTYDCKRIHLFVSYPVSSLPIVAFLYRLQNGT